MNLQKVEDVIRPLIERSGFVLYDVEFIGRTLRVCIDKAETGVSIQDCVETSRLLNPLLDVEDLITGGAYELEVGSPGLDRNLRRPEHYTTAVGEKIHVSTTEPMSKWNGDAAYFEKRKNIRGILQSFDGTTLKLLADNTHDVTIPLSAVTKAFIDFELPTTPKKGKKV